jgi:hypothetical protein
MCLSSENALRVIGFEYNIINKKSRKKSSTGLFF